MLSDTTPDAQRFYYQTLAKMSPSQRVAIAMDLTAAADELLRAAVRRRFPDADGEEFLYQLLRARYGRALADKVYCR
jgi:hypothetical protein